MHVGHYEVTVLDTFAHKQLSALDVLHARMMLGIVGDRTCRTVMDYYNVRNQGSRPTLRFEMVVRGDPNLKTYYETVGDAADYHERIL